MSAYSGLSGSRKAYAAFTLMEVVMSIAILGLAMAGMIYGYVQTNYRAEWSSMSLAAQSFAAQAVEQARAAQWSQLQAATRSITNLMLIPSTGHATNVVTTVSIASISANPPLYQLRADCYWYFPGNPHQITNTVITWRAPD